MKAGTALAAVAALTAIAPATAAADVRYASPGGTGADPCVQADPCDFETAVEDALDGDEVIVNPGVHAPSGQVVLDSAAIVHGVEDQAPPRIASVAPTAISVTSAGAELRWLDIRHSGGGDALSLADGGARRLSVQSSSGGFACHVQGATIQDSVCWSTGAGGSAAGSEVAGTYARTNLFNVTAIASGAGSQGLRVVASAGGFADVHALNLIARGGLDTEIDGTDGIAVANLDHSNYATQSVPGPYGFASAPGISRNQTAPPVFADPANGDFHQDPSSPTIDRGTLDFGVGDSDVDGDTRVQGFGIDIGADELFVGPLPPDTNPPDTRILKKPDRRAKRRLSRFKFGTTEPFRAVFMCSLDGKPFSLCDSPIKRRVKRGKRHTFAVYSIDEAGNVDPTPDEYSWKVRRKGSG